MKSSSGLGDIMLSKSDITKIKDLLYVANEIAVKCQRSGLEISYKEDKSPITNADIAISNYITEELSKITPDIPVISEEGANRTFSEVFWLVDPIDGTRGYVSGEQLYTVNIGLIVNRVPLYGFISVPESGLIYYTDQPDLLKIESGGKIVDYTTSSEEFRAVISHNVGKKVLNIIAQHGIKEYSIIPCSVKFCIIASGGADLYPRIGRTMEWDTAAGHALVNAAGGRICDMNGKTLSYGKKGFINGSFIAYSQRLLYNNPKLLH